MNKNQAAEETVSQDQLPTGTYRIGYCPQYEDECARLRDERSKRATRRDIPAVRISTGK